MQFSSQNVFLPEVAQATAPIGFWEDNSSSHEAAELWTSSAADGDVKRKDDLKEIRESITKCQHLWCVEGSPLAEFKSLLA